MDAFRDKLHTERLSPECAMSLAVAARGTWRLLEQACVPRCPGCDARYELVGGCTQVHCDACGTLHCHACARRVPTHGTFADPKAIEAAMRTAALTAEETADIFALTKHQELYLRSETREELLAFNWKFASDEETDKHTVPCVQSSSFCPLYVEERLAQNEDFALDDWRPDQGVDAPPLILQSLRMLDGKGASLCPVGIASCFAALGAEVGGGASQASSMAQRLCAESSWLLAGMPMIDGVPCRPALEVLGEMALVSAGSFEGSSSSDRRIAGMGIVLRASSTLFRAVTLIRDADMRLRREGRPSALDLLFPLLLFAGRRELAENSLNATDPSPPPLTALRFLAWLLLPVRRMPLHQHLCMSMAHFGSVFNDTTSAAVMDAKMRLLELPVPGPGPLLFASYDIGAMCAISEGDVCDTEDVDENDDVDELA